MPIYEFKCRNCGTITENLVFTIEQGDSRTCRKCGSNRTERIMSRPAVLAGRGSAGGAVIGSASECGYGNRSGVGTGNCPGNDDYIKIKGQQ